MGEPLTTINYTYDSAWKDKLVGYNGTAISTDSIGNPLNYIGRNYEGGAINGTLEWDGRQLASVTLDGARYEYEYNSDGLRTQMTIYNSNNEAENIFYYIWQGGKLQGYFVSDGSGNALYSIKLLYENGGEAAGYEVLVAEDNSRKTYIFHKNLQGDIAGIFNEQGEVLLTFTYDAWGNISTDFNTGNLENIEEAFILILTIPLTYRGYMYDIFTGLYYLQSRCYNPAYGRFLNADSIMKTGEPLGANIFAYCGNNPVNYVDYGGKTSEDIANNIVHILTVISMFVALYDMLEEEDLSFVLDYELASFSYNEYIYGIHELIITTKVNDEWGYAKYFSVKISLGTVDCWYYYYDFYDYIYNNNWFLLPEVAFSIATTFITNPFVGVATGIISIFASFAITNTLNKDLKELEGKLRGHTFNEILARIDYVKSVTIYWNGDTVTTELLSSPLYKFLDN